MRKASLLAIAAFCLGGTAIAQENLPETCRGNVSSAAYMAPDEAAKADLQCDIDRAERHPNYTVTSSINRISGTGGES